MPYLAYFDGSVRGLRAGAPVEFRGLQVGTVTGLRLQVDAGGEFSRESIRIPVTLELEPGRIDVAGGVSGTDNSQGMKRLVQQGLRAQLKSGNLLTGDLIVALDFHPYSPPAELGMTGTYPEIPTVPADLEVITSSLTDLLRKIAKLPIDDLVRDLRQTVASVNELVSSPATKETAVSLGRAAVSLEALVADLEPRLGPVLSLAEKTLASADELINESSPVRYDVSELIKETTAAARSIRLLADYLERHPEALLTGK